MSRNPNRGRIYRRCACRDTTGRQLGARCPELANRRHGRWAFAVDLPTIDGHRKTMRRCGFPTRRQAHAALHRVLTSGIHTSPPQTDDWRLIYIENEPITFRLESQRDRTHRLPARHQL